MADETKNKRDATATLKGYIFQKVVTCSEIIKLINDEKLDVFVKMEGLEDLDMISDNNLTLYQLKYYNQNQESLTLKSGVMKVIKSNYNINYNSNYKSDDIREIIIAVGSDENKYDNFKKSIISFVELLNSKRYNDITKIILIMTLGEFFDGNLGKSRRFESIMNGLNDIDIDVLISIASAIINLTNLDTDNIIEIINVGTEEFIANNNFFENCVDNKWNKKILNQLFKIKDKNCKNPEKYTLKNVDSKTFIQNLMEIDIDFLKFLISGEQATSSYWKKFSFKNIGSYKNIIKNIENLIKNNEEFFGKFDEFVNNKELIIYSFLQKELDDILFDKNKSFKVGDIWERIQNLVNNVIPGNISQQHIKYVVKTCYEFVDSDIFGLNLDKFFDSMFDLIHIDPLNIHTIFSILIKIISEDQRYHDYSIIGYLIENICKEYEHKWFLDPQLINWLDRVYKDELIGGIEYIQTYTNLDNLVKQIKKVEKKSKPTQNNL